IRPRDVTVMTRQLASLIRSGVPILRALRTIADQTENIVLRRVVDDMEKTVRDGSMLSSAMGRYPQLFSPLYIDMVRAGESGGILDTSLFRLAEARETEEDIRRKVQSAMAYPMLVVVVGIVTVFVLLSFFLPRVIELFEGYKDLPLPTRMLIGISDVFSRYWYWIAAVFVLLIAVIRRMLVAESGRMILDRLVLHIPMIRRFIQAAEIARFSRTLSLLIDAGVSIDKALQLAANTIGNTVLRGEVEAVRIGTVQKGATMSSGLKRARYFPAFVANMTAVGEEAGRLDESLLEVALFYEKEVDQQTRVATSLIEPILILIVGAVVGFIVAAMLLPIFELGSGL
ncbi:MAG: type II secretion system F family protein, partial [Verrucomicrobia bacterium]|nr:type II secretion system F family protein [Verrucomicrobiota bacterium]